MEAYIAFLGIKNGKIEEQQWWTRCAGPPYGEVTGRC